MSSRHYDDQLAKHFDIKKTREFIAHKYYWPAPCHGVKVYIKGSYVYIALKVVRNETYNNLQSLAVSTYHLKDLSMDFITGLLISINKKKEAHNSILIIIDPLIKMIYYDLL